MNKNIVIFFCLLAFPVLVLASDRDTTIFGVKIGFSYSNSIFPVSWREDPINAKGDEMDFSEISRVKPIVKKALNKYPSAVLKANLTAIYFVKKMSFYNVGFGGTNSSDAVYVSNSGEENGYSDRYIEQTIHHEYSSILMRNHISLLDTISWKNAISPGVDYNDPEAGVGAIRKHQSSQEIDTSLCQEGFLTQYAMSGMENDLNTLAQNLFCPAEGFWETVAHYPYIRVKVTLLINFYHQINPIFTENYFRNFDSR